MKSFLQRFAIANVALLVFTVVGASAPQWAQTFGIDSARAATQNRCVEMIWGPRQEKEYRASNTCDVPLTVFYCNRARPSYHKDGCPKDGAAYKRFVSLRGEGEGDRASADIDITHSLNWLACKTDEIGIKSGDSGRCEKKKKKVPDTRRLANRNACLRSKPELRAYDGVRWWNHCTQPVVLHWCVNGAPGKWWGCPPAGSAYKDIQQLKLPKRNAGQAAPSDFVPFRNLAWIACPPDAVAMRGKGESYCMRK